MERAMKTTRIRNILLALDGSAVSARASVYAVELARKLGSSVTLVSVIDNTPYTGRASIPGIAAPTHLAEPVEDYLRQAAEAFMSRIEKVCRKKNVFAKSVIRLGSPVEEILKEGRNSRADMIVVGSHGRSAVTAALLGSVAFGVVHRSRKIPVLIVR
jgi:nucleotide-binding universal stress UspA family protein